MKFQYYIRKCGHQELGSVEEGRTKRGRYFLISANTEILSFFPPLSTSEKNDSALLPIISVTSGEKTYCNYVYHNDKFHNSTASHPRNERRLYLNKSLENGELLFKKNDIVIFRKGITATTDDTEAQTIYYLLHIDEKNSLYEQYNKMLEPKKSNHLFYEGNIPYLEKLICDIRFNSAKNQTHIDPSVTRLISSQPEIEKLFNVNSFRDFVMVGYNNLCAITESVIKYSSFMNIEAAHIIPKSHGGSYIPSNGIAMSRDMHWAFDKGFFTISDDYKIVVHESVQSDYLQMFNGKKIIIPSDPFFQPDKKSLKYHRDNIFGMFLNSGKL